MRWSVNQNYTLCFTKRLVMAQVAGLQKHQKLSWAKSGDSFKKGIVSNKEM